MYPSRPLGSPLAPPGLPQSGGILPPPTSDCPFLSPADYTWTNVARLALGAGVLVLLVLIMAEATCSRRRGLGPH